MKILVLNSGSSTLKYQVINMNKYSVIVEGVCERIGQSESIIINKYNGKKEEIMANLPSHKEAIEFTLKIITDPTKGILNSFDEILAIGHRVVHGGSIFNKSVIVNKDILNEIKKLSDLAPLHNPSNALGIEICMELIPNVKNVAVFDTAFHQTIEPKAYMYGLPYEDYKELNVRKYGFHGISYKYISEEVEKLMGKDKKIIVCHLGNGASVCAIKNGISIDTSMGMTPLEGLMMGTRCGDIDPTCIFHIMKHRNLTVEELNERLNKKSGMLGIYGKSSDSRDIEQGVKLGEERAILTEDMYAYKVKSYIGSYMGALGGVDAIIFTAGIGENAAGLRGKICNGLEWLGLEFDKEVNQIRKNGIVELSKKDSKIKVYKIPTNEELMIAKETLSLMEM